MRFRRFDLWVSHSHATSTSAPQDQDHSLTEIRTKITPYEYANWNTGQVWLYASTRLAGAGNTTTQVMRQRGFFRWLVPTGPRGVPGSRESIRFVPLPSEDPTFSPRTMPTHERQPVNRPTFGGREEPKNAKIQHLPSKNQRRYDRMLRMSIPEFAFPASITAWFPSRSGENYGEINNHVLIVF